MPIINLEELKLPNGYVYELEGADWKTAPSSRWDITSWADYDDGMPPVPVGRRIIDDARCVVFRCDGNVYRAAMEICCYV